jgi:hypothetical protein
MLTLALLLQAAPAACATPAPLPAALVGFRDPITVVAGGDILVGKAARVTLGPPGATRFAVAPCRAAAIDSFAGQVTFRVASAGTYRVALDSAMWIDVVAGTAAIASTTHGHGPACSGVRKMVDFALRLGRYVIQLSGSANRQAVVMVARVG